MVQNLDDALSNFRDRIYHAIKSKKSIMVTTHMDCDGITAGSIISKALIRAGANVTVRTSKEFSASVISSIKKAGRDLNIITDLGGGFGAQLDTALGDDWVVLDHHEIASDEIDNDRIINSWKYGIDGGQDICAGGMAYLASLALDDKNVDLSAIAVISALGDRQDQGEGKSFTGMNKTILDTAVDLNLVNAERNLMLVGRETRPLVDALAFTSHPFMQGLTWNRDSCYSLLQTSGIKLKEGNRWRVPAELSMEEQSTVIESIVQFLSGKNLSDIVSELVGNTYTFPREDGRSFLRDGREFSTMLNSCGRIGKSGVGMAICMGDRNKMLMEGENILAEYRKMIRDYMNLLENQRWRISENQSRILVNGDGIIPETMTGTMSSLIAGSPKNAGKIVILRTSGEQGTVKFSSRKSYGCNNDVNLSELMRVGAARFQGIGGGHDAAAGAKITKDKLDDFLDYLEANVKVSRSDNPE